MTVSAAVFNGGPRSPQTASQNVRSADSSNTDSEAHSLEHDAEYLLSYQRVASKLWTHVT